MRKLFLLLGMVLVVTAPAYALDLSAEAGMKISNPDADYVQVGAGGQVGVFATVPDVAGLEGGVRFGITNHEVESPFSKTDIADQSQTSLDLLVKYAGLPNYKKLQPYLLAGIGYGDIDLDSDVQGLPLNAKNGARYLAGVGFEWQIHGASDESQSWTGVELALFADASVIFSDTQYQIGKLNVDVDNDSIDISSGLVLRF